MSCNEAYSFLHKTHVQVYNEAWKIYSEWEAEDSEKGESDSPDILLCNRLLVGCIVELLHGPGANNAGDCHQDGHGHVGHHPYQPCTKFSAQWFYH
jgi:hypothetical protein